ncbi:hypothetical protein IU487_33395 [Nocardia puris]|uniref:hypothetical protein n=1 Tax=Nocardia puris TaxID=208602 RepID=UPI00189566B5|nr:hypothetical protein [Nocardia puris]MBF6215895.1 hypothetical protein [Nocardia puris]
MSRATRLVTVVHPVWHGHDLLGVGVVSVPAPTTPVVLSPGCRIETGAMIAVCGESGDLGGVFDAVEVTLGPLWARTELFAAHDLPSRVDPLLEMRPNQHTLLRRLRGRWEDRQFARAPRMVDLGGVPLTKACETIHSYRFNPLPGGDTVRGILTEALAVAVRACEGYSWSGLLDLDALVVHALTGARRDDS